VVLSTNSKIKGVFKMKVILATGGAGFIGSCFIQYFLRRNKNFIIVNIDKLIYHGNMESLREIENSPRYHFIKGDICNSELMNYIFRKYKPEYILNFANDSRIDRIRDQPAFFTQTNIIGTQVLLEGARTIWSKNNYQGNRFIQISDYEVYGNTAQKTDYFLEESPLLPTNLLSASKAGADLLIQAFSKVSGLPAIIIRCCNNYGPHQTLDNFIPFCITNALSDRTIPIDGESADTREWIHVLDHCIAIIRALFYGKPGEIYNIGSGEEISNADLATRILKMLGKPEDMLALQRDRLVQNKRFAINSYKARNNLRWASKIQLDQGLKDTIQWYKSNRTLWENRQ